MGSRAALKVLVLARSCHSKVLNPYPTMLNRCSPAKRSRYCPKVDWFSSRCATFSSSALLCWSLCVATLWSWCSSRSIRCRSCSICLRSCSIRAFSSSSSQRSSGSAPVAARETPATPTTRNSSNTPSENPRCQLLILSLPSPLIPIVYPPEKNDSYTLRRPYGFCTVSLPIKERLSRLPRESSPLGYRPPHEQKDLLGPRYSWWYWIRRLHCIRQRTGKKVPNLWTTAGLADS